MAVLRVAHVWGDRLLDVRHLAGSGALGTLKLVNDRIEMGGVELALAAGQTLACPLGPTELRLSWVERQPPVAPTADDADWSFARLVACLLLLAAAAAAVFHIQVGLGLAEDDSALSRIPFAARKILVQPPPKRLVLERTAEAAVAKPREEAPSRSATPKAQSPLKAKSAGILGLLDGLADAQRLFAPGGISPGVLNALNQLDSGARIGDARGLGGMGPRGFGPGDASGLDLGGGGFTRRTAGGAPGAELVKRFSTGPCCGETHVTDGLSKELIAKVIRRHFAEIKFCYEQALQQQPQLAGKVVVLFVIDATGAVSDANVAEATLEEPNVEACVLARVRRWKFPEPQGGGVVSVTHPWFFKPAGSED